MNRRHHSQGFTLIEILVAILVFGMGVLGVAALSATSQKSSMKAYHSMLATWKAHELMELIRANGSYASTGSNNYQHQAGALPAAPAKTCTQIGGTAPANDCAPADVSEDDLYQWLSSLNGFLPSASGAVSSAASSYIVTVYWDSGAESQTCTTAGWNNLSMSCQSLEFTLPQ